MSHSPVIHLIGNAHLDPVWLWRWQEGFAEIKATFKSALDRMEEFPEFTFTCACAAYYKWVEENCPEMFDEIRKRVKEGRWFIAGGWWIQPDCNLPAGESFARHSLYSQRYFNEKFGIMAKVGYNVDSFGHNSMLPQILKKSGMDYYVFMRPGSHEKDLPGNLFRWESPDGSQVIAFKIPYSYANWFGEPDNQEPAEIQKLRTEIELARSQKIDFMFFYGVGNHGGGPTIANLKSLRKIRQELKDVELLHSSPDAYFKAVKYKKDELPVVREDLQHHASGCYSAHSQTKANIRKTEHRLMSAEKFAVISENLMGLPYPGDRLQKAWTNLLFNQFHDIAGGCSIKEAYDDVGESFGEALNIGAEVANMALQKISWAIDTMGENKFYISKEKDMKTWEAGDTGAPLVVFNPLSWEVAAPIQVNRAVKGISDDKGVALEVQEVRASQTNAGDKADSLFIGKLPAMGYRVFRMFKDKELKPLQEASGLKAEYGALENGYVRLELDTHTGYIRSLFDKPNGIEIISGAGAVPVVVDEFDSDTWSHGIFEFRNETGKFSDASIRLLEKGPLRARLRVMSRYNQSTLQQDFLLHHDRPEIEVRVKLDWREQHKMLKLSFPLNLQDCKAVYEIPYGFIEKPADGKEEAGQQWFDVSGLVPGKEECYYGLAVLNTAKYSYDVKDNDMRLTVVRSPIYADHFGQRDEYCEFMDQGIQEFSYMLLPHCGDWKKTGIVAKAYQLNVQPFQIIETYHKGSLPLVMEGIDIKDENIIAAVLKKGEDGNAYVLRCYECEGRETETTIELPMLNRKWVSRFGKCEIKTFLIPLNEEEEVTEANLLEMPYIS